MDEMKGNDYKCYTMEYLIENNIISGLEYAYYPYYGYEGRVVITKTGDEYKYNITLVDYDNYIYISENESDLNNDNVNDLSYYYQVPNCDLYNSPS